MTKYILLTVYFSNNLLECINVWVQSYHMMPKRDFKGVLYSMFGPDLVGLTVAV